MGSVAERVVRTASCPVLTVRQPPGESDVPQVLVAVDFEPASDTALTYGRALARMFGARLHLLHVVENNFLRPIASDPRTVAERAQRRLRQRLAPEDSRAPGVAVAVEVSDTPADAIVDYAGDSGIDLIVIGTHGRRGKDRLLMGSVAERVIRRAPCPVLTVRHPEREFVCPDVGEIGHAT
jgi:nucleotide-binding universal stress UspA family protein